MKPLDVIGQACLCGARDAKQLFAFMQGTQRASDSDEEAVAYFRVWHEFAYRAENL